MATINGSKYSGPYTFDLNDVKEHLVDLPPGAMKGIRREKPGMKGVIEELAGLSPEQWNAADVPPQAYQRFVQRTEVIKKLRTRLLALEKAVEVCTETLAKTENDREDDVSVIVKAAQRTAQRNKGAGIDAPFEKTIAYNGQIAEKAAQTRRKNEGGDDEPPAGPEQPV